ncbi:MAG: DUF1345 domain-containing protein [Hyphomicrobiales bacterium]|nr:DUF1345 domain-containing protein [Hyphomicrobiales bacterium]
MLPLRVVTARPRLFVAIAVGACVGFAAPEAAGVVARVLIGWNAAVVSYIAAVLYSMRDASPPDMRYRAQLLDDGRLTVLALCVLAGVAAIAAIVVELGLAHDAHGVEKAWRLCLAGCTILSAWFFIHTEFALHYAHEFYLERVLTGAEAEAPTDLDGDIDDDDLELAKKTSDDPRGGLIFPGTKQPTYSDFAYFSFIIGVASQTADVEISSRPMRRVSLAHSILAFFFNTAILALTINIVAGLF